MRSIAYPRSIQASYMAYDRMDSTEKSKNVKKQFNRSAYMNSDLSNVTDLEELKTETASPNDAKNKFIDKLLSTKSQVQNEKMELENERKSMIVTRRAIIACSYKERV